MNIAFCDSFLKQLNKLGSVKLIDIKTLLRKYPNTPNIVELDHFESGTSIVKCYLLSKKIRLLVLLRTSQGNFIPISIVRKETKEGKNITKENYQELFKNSIDRILKEYTEDKYTVEEL
ncbi:hypothetical protein WDW89_12030 [Deltaproteobacteria bacterium TL4]